MESDIDEAANVSNNDAAENESETPNMLYDILYNILYNGVILRDWSNLRTLRYPWGRGPLLTSSKCSPIFKFSAMPREVI